jgi:hypothetical protein
MQIHRELRLLYVSEVEESKMTDSKQESKTHQPGRLSYRCEVYITFYIEYKQ